MEKSPWDILTEAVGCFNTVQIEVTTLSGRSQTCPTVAHQNALSRQGQPPSKVGWCWINPSVFMKFRLDLFRSVWPCGCDVWSTQLANYFVEIAGSGWVLCQADNSSCSCPWRNFTNFRWLGKPRRWIGLSNSQLHLHLILACRVNRMITQWKQHVFQMLSFPFLSILSLFSSLPFQRKVSNFPAPTLNGSTRGSGVSLSAWNFVGNHFHSI